MMMKSIEVYGKYCYLILLFIYNDFYATMSG